MKKLRRAYLVAAIAGVIGMAAYPLPTLAAQTTEHPTVTPDRISVYNININKMDREWQDWIRWIDQNDVPIPDLILVQDMENATERLRFQRRLRDTFGGRWHGRGGASTGSGWHTAVVWRGARFDVETVKKRGWWGFGDPAPKDGNPLCLDDKPDGAASETHNGAPAVQVRLKDKLASDRFVSAVSFKTSGRETPKTCAWKNMRKVNFKLQQQGWTGDIMVMGTDANSSDRADSGAWRCWYRGSNARIVDANGTPEPGCFKQLNQRFYDPMYEKCSGDSRGVKACLTEDHFTRKSIRIDFIFAKLASDAPVQFDLSETQTLPWSLGSNKAMTDHRTQRTVIHY